MENPIKIDDLGVPLFLETPIYVPSPYLRYSSYTNPYHGLVHSGCIMMAYHKQKNDPDLGIPVVSTILP